MSISGIRGSTGWGSLTLFCKAGESSTFLSHLDLSFYNPIHLSLASGTLPQNSSFLPSLWAKLRYLTGLNPVFKRDVGNKC